MTPDILIDALAFFIGTGRTTGMDTDCRRSGRHRRRANDAGAAYLPLRAPNALHGTLGTISKSANVPAFRIKVPGAGAHVIRQRIHPRASCAPRTRAYVMHPRTNTRNPHTTHILTHTPAHQGRATQPEKFSRKNSWEKIPYAHANHGENHEQLGH